MLGSNIRYSMTMQLLVAALQPILVGASLILPRAFGAGWITFADGVFGWCLAFLAVIIVTDLLEYLSIGHSTISRCYGKCMNCITVPSISMSR
ncbi:hypothetical protein ACTMU2_24195 [Cupriavidus basilensis]